MQQKLKEVNVIQPMKLPHAHTERRTLRVGREGVERLVYDGSKIIVSLAGGEEKWVFPGGIGSVMPEPKPAKKEKAKAKGEIDVDTLLEKPPSVPSAF